MTIAGGGGKQSSDIGPLEPIGASPKRPCYVRQLGSSLEGIVNRNAVAFQSDLQAALLALGAQPYTAVLLNIAVPSGSVMLISGLEFYVTIIGPDGYALRYRDEFLLGTGSRLEVLIGGQRPFDVTSTPVGVAAFNGFSWLNRNVLGEWNCPTYLIAKPSQTLVVQFLVNAIPPGAGPGIAGANVVGAKLSGRWLPYRVWKQIEAQEELV